MTSQYRQSELGQVGHHPAWSPADRQDGAEREVPVDRIEPNPYQPRTTCADSELRDLADSIAAHGQLQAVLVRPHPDDPSRYQLLAGERRWRAARLAGLECVRAVCRPDVDDARMLLLAYQENAQRVDLSPVEEATAFDQMMHLNGWTTEEVARQVRKSRVYVGERLALLADESIQAAVREGLMTVTVAREALRRLAPAQRRQLVEAARQDGTQVTSELVQARAVAEPMAGRRTAGASRIVRSSAQLDAADAPSAPLALGTEAALQPADRDGDSVRANVDRVEPLALLAPSPVRTPPPTSPPVSDAALPVWLMTPPEAFPAIDPAANRRTHYLLQDLAGLLDQVHGLRVRANQYPDIFVHPSGDAELAIRASAVALLKAAVADAFALVTEWEPEP